jgi:membrane protein YqaA with SNARE-associated domain
MEFLLIGIVIAAVGVVAGGVLGYLYGQSVQRKVQAVEQAAVADVKRVL